MEEDQLLKDNGGRERGVEGTDGVLRRRRSDRGLDLDGKRIFPVRFLFSIGWLVDHRVQDCQPPDCGGTTNSSRIREEGGGG